MLISECKNLRRRSPTRGEASTGGASSARLLDEKTLLFEHISLLRCAVMSFQTFDRLVPSLPARALLCGLALVGMTLSTSGCQSSSEEPNGSGGTTGLGGAGPDGASCEEFKSEHDALLNAETDAVVVRKKPNIPKAQ